MGPRQEAQRHVMARERPLRQHGAQPQHVAHEVSVGQAHALGGAGGAAGVDKGGQIVGVRDDSGDRCLLQERLEHG